MLFRSLVESQECQLSYGISGYSNDKAVERCMATINKLIRVYSLQQGLTQDKWLALIPRIAQHMRTIPDQTGESPYFRVFGIKPNKPALKWEPPVTGAPQEKQTIINMENGNLMVDSPRGDQRELQPVKVGEETFYTTIYQIDSMDKLSLQEARQ